MSAEMAKICTTRLPLAGPKQIQATCEESSLLSSPMLQLTRLATSLSSLASHHPVCLATSGPSEARCSLLLLWSSGFVGLLWVALGCLCLLRVALDCLWVALGSFGLPLVAPDAPASAPRGRAGAARNLNGHHSDCESTARHLLFATRASRLDGQTDWAGRLTQLAANQLPIGRPARVQRLPPRASWAGELLVVVIVVCAS